MDKEQKKKVCVVGGGLAGPMIGIMLARQGYSVKVIEGRKDMRKLTINAGRSINLTLSVRGFQALEQVGLKDVLLKISIPLIGRMIHDVDGGTNLQRYGINDSEAIYTVSRGQLNCELLKLAENTEGLQLKFGTQCTKYQLKKNILDFTSTDPDNLSQEQFQVKDHLVIAADGYNSIIRRSMMDETRQNFSQVYESHGYKELIIPAGQDGSWLIDKNAFHIWPRGGFMLIAQGKLDGSFSCTLFLSYQDGRENFKKLDSDQKILNFFQIYFPDFVNLVPNIVEQFHKVPIGELCTVKSWPWNYKDQTVLIGDSAHGLVPFYGQGMNCAFEDCVIFSKMLGDLHDTDLSQNDWEDLLEAFAKSRKPNSDAIQDMAVQNFVELRDDVNDPFFKLKKDCELKIAKKFPEFKTKYQLVSFSTTPYSIAMQKGEIQNQILSQLCYGISHQSEFDEQGAFDQITKRYKELGI